MLHQPFFAKRRSIRATIPLAHEADGVMSDTMYPVVLPQVGREVEPLNGSTAPRAAFHPTTGVGAELWRSGNRDQPPGILVREIMVETIVVALCSVLRHYVHLTRILNRESYCCSAAEYDHDRHLYGFQRNIRPRCMIYNSLHCNAVSTLFGVPHIKPWVSHMNAQVGLLSGPSVHILTW